MTKAELIKHIEQILYGIDMQETQDPEGYWETSTGAKFGAGKLDELRQLVNSIDELP